MAFYRIRETSKAGGGLTLITPVEKAASATAVNLLPELPARKSLSIINESDFELLINTGEISVEANRASLTNKFKIIPAQTEYTWGAHEIPLEALNGIWIGSVTPTGKAVIVEGI